MAEGYDIGLSGTSTSGAAQGSGATDTSTGSNFGGATYGPGSLVTVTQASGQTDWIKWALGILGAFSAGWFGYTLIKKLF